MKRKIFAAFLFCCVLSTQAFCEEISDCRKWDAVLGIESYMKWVRSFDGEKYAEDIAPEDYALIGKKEAFSAYKKKADAGDVRAMCAVAECYDYGVLDNPDFESAFYYWNLAGEQGYAPALNALATFFVEGSYHAISSESDEEKADELFERAASEGYCKALVNLRRFDEAARKGYKDAYLYEAIDESEKGDVEKAILAFEKAANEGNSIYALRSLLKIFTDEKTFDSEKAQYWARRYKDERYKKILSSREKKAALLPLLKKRADVGDIYSMFDLSLLYGSNSFDFDNPSYRALHIYYLKKAAEGGHKKAQKTLALYYDRGDGVLQDKKKAADLYQKSMRKNDSVVESALRDIYIEALPAPARSYVNYRAQERDGESAHYYSRMYSDAYDEIDFECAAKYLLSMSEKDSDARNAAAFCFEFGIGLEEDKEKAGELFYSPIPQEKAESEEQYNERRDEFLKNRAQEEARLIENAKESESAEDYYSLFEFYNDVYNLSLEEESRCFLLLTKAAEKGSIDALRELSRYYQDGKSCAVDAKRAADCLIKASAKGNAKAKEMLSEYYFQGFGVPYDFDRAVELLEEAESLGSESARLSLKALGFPTKEFDEEGLDDDYDADDYGAIWGNAASGDTTALSEEELSELGEASVISLKSQIESEADSQESAKDCAIKFWTSVLRGDTNGWKECFASRSENGVSTSGEAIEKQKTMLENVFSIARVSGNLERVEIRFFFESAKIDGDLTSIPAALYQDGAFVCASDFEFFFDNLSKKYFVVF